VGIVPQDWVGHFVSFILGQSFGIQTGARIWAFLEKVLLARKKQLKVEKVVKEFQTQTKSSKESKGPGICDQLKPLCITRQTPKTQKGKLQKEPP
jgi:hypothetical protein